MKQIKCAIVGVGNCASALVQGISKYKNGKADQDSQVGLMHYDLGGYIPESIEFVAAFDIDARKVGKPLSEAIFAKPNCTKLIFKEVGENSVIVSMGNLLDGVSEHTFDYPENRRFIPADRKAEDVEKILRETGAEVLLNYLPVGSEDAAKFYAECCLNTGVSLINCMPVFIASEERWAKRFKDRQIPIVGDDVKSQVGATILHRSLVKLFSDRGVKIDRTYQLNTGGNTDFLNMLNHSRLKSKRISKTSAVQSLMPVPLEPENIHIGPSDYVPWQNDNKVCFLRIEGRGFGEIPMEVEIRLSVEDSPNSGGVTVDAIRCCKLARDRKVGGTLTSVSAYFMKHPPEQIPDYRAAQNVEQFILGKLER
ncbi:inositol-3-phosphate synthase [Acidobacteriota bacterium]